MKSFATFLAISLLVSACSRKTESTVPVSEPISVDASKPHFTISAGDLAVPAKVGTRVVGSGHDVAIFIHLEFSPAKADEFHKFTREHLNQQTQLLVGTNVFAEPTVMAEISGGQSDIACGSIDHAKAVADALKQKVMMRRQTSSPVILSQESANAIFLQITMAQFSAGRSPLDQKTPRGFSHAG